MTHHRKGRDEQLRGATQDYKGCFRAVICFTSLHGAMQQAPHVLLELPVKCELAIHVSAYTTAKS